MANPIPEGYSSVTPYLVLDDAAAAIEFYKKGLGAVEVMRLPGPDGKGVAHAEIKIGDSIIMLGDEPGPARPGNLTSPRKAGVATSSILLYVKDVDALMKQSLDAGATLEVPVETFFWGDRMGRLTDPFGHSWAIATHVEDVAPEELARRAQKHADGAAA